MEPDLLLNVADYSRAARAKLPKNVFDYYEGGALDEVTLRENTAGWDEGQALEHLVIRAFRLNKLEAEYPYDVPPGGKAIEQIDGLVYLNCYTFLIECKDKETVDIEAIAKGRFAQRLASRFKKNICPQYIRAAVKFLADKCS